MYEEGWSTGQIVGIVILVLFILLICCSTKVGIEDRKINVEVSSTKNDGNIVEFTSTNGNRVMLYYHGGTWDVKESVSAENIGYDVEPSLPQPLKDKYMKYAESIGYFEFDLGFGEVYSNTVPQDVMAQIKKLDPKNDLEVNDFFGDHLKLDLDVNGGRARMIRTKRGSTQSKTTQLTDPLLDNPSGFFERAKNEALNQSRQNQYSWLKEFVEDVQQPKRKQKKVYVECNDYGGECEGASAPKFSFIDYCRHTTDDGKDKYCFVTKSKHYKPIADNLYDKVRQVKEEDFLRYYRTSGNFNFTISI